VKDRSPALLSFRTIEWADLRRLLDLALADRETFFRKVSRLGGFVCYAAHPKRRWYAKRINHVDSGTAKFGQSESTKPGFIGRRAI